MRLPEALQYPDPVLCPPALAKRTALRPRLDAAGDRSRLRRWRKPSFGTVSSRSSRRPLNPPPRRRKAQRVPAVGRSSNSVSQDSPLPTTFSATLRLLSISASMCSSSVPRKRTYVPERAASADAIGTDRSPVLDCRIPPPVEVEDVIGARKDSSPYPPALREERRSARPRPSWKRSTMSSRRRFGTEPCKTALRARISAKVELSEVRPFQQTV